MDRPTNNKDYIEDVASDVSIMLQSLRVPARRLNLTRDGAVMFVCEVFGVLVVVYYLDDKGYLLSNLNETYPNYRYIFISSKENLAFAREDIILQFMKSGYNHYIRTTYPRQFTDLLVMHGYADKIISERLKIWDNQPKYKYLIQDNLTAKRLSATMVLAKDPAFYDYMPE